MKTLIIFALILSSLTPALAQTGTVTERFRAAQEAFDNSQFERTLTLLDAMEKDSGKSPRIESLRALTLRDLNRPRDAYLSLLTYFKLTEGMNLASPAHKSLVELRDTLRSQLETDLSAKKENLQSARNENALKAISEADPLSKPSTQSSTEVGDPLAELEMWNKVKVSTDANDYRLFLMRFPGGSFAKQAKAKMNDIGDPVWNELKKSKDPFRYRDYVKQNPNSPFIDEVREELNMLAASTIAWEQIKDNGNVDELNAFIEKYPEGSKTEEAKKLAQTIAWELIKDSKNIQDYKAYVRNYPTGAYAEEAKSLINIHTESLALAQKYYESGLAYYKKDRGAAIREFTKAVESNPQHDKAYNLRGRAYYNSKEYDLSILDMTRSIELNPQDAYAYYVRGLAYHDKGDPNTAIRDYSTAIEINPNVARIYDLRGIAYGQIGRKDLRKADESKFKELVKLNGTANNF